MTDLVPVPLDAPDPSAAGAFSAAERDAMKARTAEARAAARRTNAAEKAAADAADVLRRIAGMSEPDRSLVERLHAVITAAGPSLAPRLWYGMPAYALDGRIVCHVQAREKFRTRYATLGFSDAAHLDDGRMWPTSFALATADDVDDEAVAALVVRAVG